MVLYEKSRTVLSLVRLQPFDISTAEGRSSERHRRVVLSTITSAVARLVSILTALISVPLTLHYLGVERYGLWITISSTITLLGFADLGIGNGVVNMTAEANGKNDHKLAQTYVSSAFILLFGITILLLTIFIISYPWISWSAVFNISTDQAAAEVGPSVAIFTLCFLLNIPLGIVAKAQAGYQEGFLVSSWQAVSSLLSLAGLLVAVTLKAGLPWLVLMMAGTPVLTMALNGLLFFGFQRSWLRPKRQHFSMAAGSQILKVGSLFFILQIAVAVAYNADNLVLARILGASAVPQYAVPFKLFSLIPMLLGFALTPLWPAYRESIAAGDKAWVKKTFTRSFVTSCAVSWPIALLLTLFGKPLIGFWTDHQITPSFLLLTGLGIWGAIVSFNNAFVMLLHGLGAIKFQVICAIFMAIANLGLSIWLVGRIGVSGVVYGSIIAQSIFVLLPSGYYIYSMLYSPNAVLHTSLAEQTKAL